MRDLQTPFTKEDLVDLKAGDRVTISGKLYTARDVVHQELLKLLEDGRELPFDIKGACIYYTGPAPHRDGEVIGSCGPTTGYRMDAYTPALLDAGMLGMIGKGKRGEEVIQSIVDHGAVYFTAIGGAAALIKSTVVENRILAYKDYGAEALRELVVEKFPVTVTVDSQGRDLYKIGRASYLEKRDRT